MTTNISDLAYQITADSPEGAARTTARLFKSILDQLPPGSAERFSTAFQAEMARLGWRAQPDARYKRLWNLPVGTRFRTLNGRQYRKIDPHSYEDFRDQLVIQLEAFDLELGQPAYLPGGEVVEVSALLPGR